MLEDVADAEPREQRVEICPARARDPRHRAVRRRPTDRRAADRGSRERVEQA
jgi:hypothetical protein